MPSITAVGGRRREKKGWQTGFEPATAGTTKWLSLSGAEGKSAWQADLRRPPIEALEAQYAGDIRRLSGCSGRNADFCLIGHTAGLKGEKPKLIPHGNSLCAGLTDEEACRDTRKADSPLVGISPRVRLCGLCNTKRWSNRRQLLDRETVPEGAPGDVD
jgi:hypothetical protein